MKSGDVLMKWNGKDIKGTEALLGFLSEAKPGEKVQVELVRDGKEVVLAERPLIDVESDSIEPTLLDRLVKPL